MTLTVLFEDTALTFFIIALFIGDSVVFGKFDWSAAPGGMIG